MNLIAMKTPQEFVDNWRYTLKSKSGNVTRGYSDGTKRDIIREFCSYKAYIDNNNLYDGNLVAFLQDKDAFVQYIKGETQSIDTKKKRLSHVSSYLKFNNLVDDQGQTIYSKFISTLGTEALETRQQTPVDNNTEYINKVLQMPETNFEEQRNKLILLCYVCYAPRRGDYASVKVRNVKKGESYFDFSNNNFIFPCLLKVDKPGSTNVSEEHSKLVKKLTNSHNCDYLFCFKTPRGEFKPYTNKSFCKLISKLTENVFGKKLTLLELRKMWASNAYAQAASPREQHQVAQQLANEMGNSASTQFNYYLNNVEQAVDTRTQMSTQTETVAEPTAADNDVVKLCIEGVTITVRRGASISLL